jgi:hypothetical protein
MSREQNLKGEKRRTCTGGGEDNERGEQTGIRLAVITQHEYFI